MKKISHNVGEETYPKIIAVDFDGTLCENAWPEIGLPRLEVIGYVRKQREQGAKLILWTCREGPKLLDAIYWSALYGVYFDAVNTNLPSSIERFGGDSRKIYADEYLDDKGKGTDEVGKLKFSDIH